ncbi:four-helix bundle copper-binding protein [Spirosoma luteum]|uniref:four-helix bundle copper-binding protein n=1 Tax=Spirosoma luteum TaxID=431553 RepID=UPI00039A74A6|nr:four-helix bundle copper-binding protein [Spirosoma luteum]
MHQHKDALDDTLIQTLINCARACDYCATACLQDSDVQMMSRCIALDRDCADICFQGARLLERNAEISHQFLIICEEICRMCADECGKHDHDHCRECADACRTCAEACHQHHEKITQA